MLFDEWSGRKIGDYQIRLWGSERDIVSGKKDWMNKIYRWMRNEVFLNTFVMSEDVIKKYINVINETKPKMIEVMQLQIALMGQTIWKISFRRILD